MLKAGILTIQSPLIIVAHRHVALESMFWVALKCSPIIQYLKELTPSSLTMISFITLSRSMRSMIGVPLTQSLFNLTTTLLLLGTLIRTELHMAQATVEDLRLIC